MADTPSILSQYRFDPNSDPGTEPIVMRIEGKNIASLQNFIGVTGLPKNGKGKYSAAMVASAITHTEVFGIRTRLPEERQRIAWIATDESKHDLHNTCTVIKKLSSSENFTDNFAIYNARRADCNEIITLINQHLEKHTDCSMIVIDNIADMLMNYNDETQSKKIIDLLKSWTDRYNIIIVALLHLGKGNLMSLGTLGSHLDRYAQTVLKIQKDEERDIYTMSAKMMRSDAHFSPIDIFFDKEAKEWKQTYHIDESEKKLKPLIARPSELDKTEHRAKLSQIFNSQSLQDYTLLLSNIKIFYSRGTQWAKECITHIVTDGLVLNTKDGFLMAPTGQSKLFIQQ